MIHANQYVSIGKACKTRYQLDRFLRLHYPQYVRSSYFFDWLWGPGIDGATKALANRLQIIRENFCIKYADAKPQVFDTVSGYYFLHDFKFSESAYEDEATAIREMDQQFEKFKEKYAYLASKTIEALQGRRSDFCFVYNGNLDQASLIHFFDVLKQEYDCEPSVLNVIEFSAQMQKALDQYFIACRSENQWIDRWHAVVVDDRACAGSANEWQGVDASWDEAFTRAALFPSRN